MKWTYYTDFAICTFKRWITQSFRTICERRFFPIMLMVWLSGLQNRNFLGNVSPYTTQKRLANILKPNLYQYHGSPTRECLLSSSLNRFQHTIHNTYIPSVKTFFFTSFFFSYFASFHLFNLYWYVFVFWYSIRAYTFHSHQARYNFYWWDMDNKQLFCGFVWQ